MTIANLCDRAISLLDLVAKKSTKNAEEATQVIQELTRLKGWAYPYLATEDIAKVVRCRKCKYYKKYKKKNDRKSPPFWACSKTMIQRDPDFYCKEGSNL